jgi:hypothetical protein
VAGTSGIAIGDAADCENTGICIGHGSDADNGMASIGGGAQSITTVVVGNPSLTGGLNATPAATTIRATGENGAGQTGGALTVSGGPGGAGGDYGNLTLNGGSVILQDNGASLDCSAGDQYLTTDASGIIACGTDDGGAVGTDAVGTAELDDDANTPTAGDFVVVETGDASFDYLTPDAGTDVTADLEEEAHVTEHAENGADELLGESMGTACTENQILKANASGGLDCAADATGGSPTFDAIATGTNTTATMTVGTGASVVASGSGAITATGVAADSVALTTDTTGDYVSSATASQGLTVTGTEGASVGVQDCAANEILKRNAGDTAWECAADSTGGTPSFDAVTSGTNTTAAMVIGSGASLRSMAGILGIPNGTTNPANCTEADAFWDTDDDELNICSATDTWAPITGGGAMPDWQQHWTASALLPIEHATNSIPPTIKEEGANVDLLVLAFDDAADECRGGTFTVPSEVDTSGSVEFRVVWYSPTATTGDIVWDFRHIGRTEGDAWDAALTTETSSADTTQGTIDLVTTTVWTETISNAGWAADDLIEFEVCRDADNGSDTLAGDAYMISFAVVVPRA